MRLQEDGWTIVDVFDAQTASSLLKRMEDERDSAHAHSKFMWDIRRHPDVLRAFVKVWDGNTDLCTGFDGSCIRHSNHVGLVLPWHVDQNHTHADGMVCVQALLCLTDVLDESGGTVLLSGSHRHHKAVSMRHKSDEEWEYIELRPTDRIFTGMGLEAVKPTLNAGQMLVWDSRVAHRVVPPSDIQTRRAVVYMSMVPRSYISDDVIRERIRGFESGISTTHWPSRFVDRGEERLLPPWATLKDAPEDVQALIVGKEYAARCVA